MFLFSRVKLIPAALALGFGRSNNVEDERRKNRVKSACLVEQTCRWAKTPLPRRVETRLSMKSNTQQESNSANILRLAFASEGG